jgi:lipoate-protein ligase A
MRWHFLQSDPADGVTNMAVDEALMLRASERGEAVFRIYGWSSPTLSLGRNQRARDQYNLAAAAARGVSFVRRPTGGRALLHHREITYSATLPVSSAADSRSAYDFINDVLIDGLRRLGAGVGRASGTPALPPGPRPCFDVPSEHEIVLGTRKLVGSAQWRHGGALLQHGSILVQDDQQVIASVMHEPSATPRAATLAEALGREPSVEELGQLLRDALRDRTGSAIGELRPDAVLLGAVDRLSGTYRDDAWTWRR